MDTIDPSLRAEEHQQQQQPTGTDVSENAFVFTNDTSNAIEHDAQLAQQLAAQGIPYYNDQLEHAVEQPEQQRPLPPQSQKVAIPATPAPIITQQHAPIQFTPNEPKRRPKSCESCRGLKVKCEPNEAGQGEGPCKRCIKAGRECVYSETSGRRKKKQDNKVAELEKKVNGLTAALLAQQGTEASDGLEGKSKKRSRSEFEQDEQVEGRQAKVQATMPIVDVSILNELVKTNEHAVQGLIAGLKTIDTWYKQKHPVRSVNGSKAPIAQMGRTPLDLLSQVASSEKHPQSQVYSPYGGYYDKRDGTKNELAETLQKEFGSRTELVLGFLGLFLQGPSKSVGKEEAAAKS